jgi:hypothetical protein
MAVQNYQRALSIDERVAIQLLWMHDLADKDDQVVEDAMWIVFKHCHYWPNIADIQQAIAELQQERQYKQDKPGLLEEAERHATDYGKMCLRIVKSGKFSGPDYERVKKDAIEDVNTFARMIFPDITDESIWRNYPELSNAQKRALMCDTCLWMPRDCNYKGYVPVLRFDKGGLLIETSTPCQKRRGA